MNEMKSERWMKRRMTDECGMNIDSMGKMNVELSGIEWEEEGGLHVFGMRGKIQGLRVGECKTSWTLIDVLLDNLPGEYIGNIKLQWVKRKGQRLMPHIKLLFSHPFSLQTLLM